ncbi:hypothetical protein [Chitinophaga sp. LS1]|uniref:hypothetical protein n=1 Tax=Chitinophaga sp. LS1 TaxID=3051176 RepID=UPI002AAA6ABD|nr:hypothetical protein [Chitinophaga sp. LS1]WPV67788.1 hypothetical protein QQL36_03480 [Chitinophaga sp. LS1]
MTDDNEICMINLSNGLLDNDYTFYESGKIKHFYDKHSFSLNNEEWMTGKDVRDSDKVKILEKCPEQYKKVIKKILGE